MDKLELMVILAHVLRERTWASAEWMNVAMTLHGAVEEMEEDGRVDDSFQVTVSGRDAYSVVLEGSSGRSVQMVRR